MAGKKIDKVTGLTQQQKLFYEQYIIDMNITKAAIRAGYSEDTACAQGSRLLKHVKGKEYLDKLLEDKSEQLGISSVEVIEGIKSIAFAPDTSAGIRLQAFKVLGEYLQMFNQNQKVDLNLTGGLVIVDDIGSDKDE